VRARVPTLPPGVLACIFVKNAPPGKGRRFFQLFKRKSEKNTLKKSDFTLEKMQILRCKMSKFTLEN
jgi:hypothetical protein